MILRSLPLLTVFIGPLAMPAMLAAAEPPASQASRTLRVEDALAGESPAALAHAARRDGDARRGALIFYQPHLACTKCHLPGTDGQRVGPDLSKPQQPPDDAFLVESLLSPSQVINEQYQPMAVVTNDGRTLSGLLVRETDDALVLRDASRDYRERTVPKETIEQWQKTKQSIMPAGLLSQIGSRQQLLDLVRYLMDIAQHGPDRARALQPDPSLFAAAAVPEYESEIDHAGLIADLDKQGLKRGKAIFERLCVNCHGTLEQSGSLPTSLRFASGQFKNGSDPYSIYRTLTYGFGLMMPQSWMVPQQKYDVIHYLREEYVKRHNPGQYFRVSPEYLAGLPQGSSRGPEPSEIEAWSAMDYGPSLAGTYQLGSDRNNIAFKGIAVRLDPGSGGVAAGGHWIVYDHDTMRVAGTWAGKGFIDWNGIQFNGRHGVHPRTVGQVVYTNPDIPGWADPASGRFDAARIQGRDGRHYGPLPREWIHFQGLYHFGNRTLLAYTVGDTTVLEMPGLTGDGQQAIYTRTLNIGPRRHDLVLQVAHQAGGTLRADGSSVIIEPSGTQRQEDHAMEGFDGGTYLQIAQPGAFDLTSRDYTITARIKTRRGGTIFAQTRDSQKWSPDGKSLFIRGGKLVLDIGWVGAVESEQKLDDGRWHDVAVTWQERTGRVELFIDGKRDGSGRLRPKKEAKDHVVRIGYTAADFPEGASFFTGRLDDVRFYQRRLSSDQLRKPGPEKLLGHWKPDRPDQDRVDDHSGHGHHGRWVSSRQSAPLRGPLAAAAQPFPEGARWSYENGHLRLTLPAGEEPLRFTVSVCRTAGDKPAVTVATIPNPDWDLAAMTRGGPPRWPQRLQSEMLAGKANGPFAVDVLNHPVSNPWQCQVRLSGFDFFSSGDRMAVCSWDGDVWLVDGLRDPAGQLTWQRIASGLFQPLGLKIVDGRIYVTCRDQIVILHDLNGDGETDYYENFNSDHQVTEHFHEFAMGLQRDAEGNFYYAKAARHAAKALVPHHGTLLRVSPDGLRTDILATGFRAPNGVCLNPDGTFFVTDQEGHWIPKNRINWIRRPGDFFGNMWGYHDVTDPSDRAMQPPLCWITNRFDRSPAELLWVPEDSWGPLSGSLLNLSYGYGRIFVVPHERVGEQMQGGMSRLPIADFPTGIMRGRFHPSDGHLYASGLFVWAGNRLQPGGLYRVRYTGQPIHVPLALSATQAGLEITFSGELNPQRAVEAANYDINVWGLKRSAQYGSDHLDERPLAVESVTLSPDHRRVRLNIPQITPTRCMEINYRLTTRDGKPLEGTIHSTIHQLNPGPTSFR